MLRPSAKSLILDLLSTVRRGAMPVRALIAAAELFEITENSLRVSLARLYRAHRVTRDSRGHYRLGHAASSIDGHLQRWRRADEQLVPWPIDRNGRGCWSAVHVTDSPRRSSPADAEAQPLRLLGMRELEAGLFIRPDNLVGGVPRTRYALQALGLAPHHLVFRVGELDDTREHRARQLWEPDALRAKYRDLCARIARSETRLRQLPREASMVESFLLGGEAIRTIALDPLLPSPIVPNGEFAALVQATRRYDVVGRACWSEFLARYRVVHRRPPVDVRIGDAAGVLIAPPKNERIPV